MMGKKKGFGDLFVWGFLMYFWGQVLHGKTDLGCYLRGVIKFVRSKMDIRVFCHRKRIARFF